MRYACNDNDSSLMYIDICMYKYMYVYKYECKYAQYQAIANKNMFQ